MKSQLYWRMSMAKLAISGLPFAYEYEAKDVFDDPEINTPEDILKAQINSTKKAYRKRHAMGYCCSYFCRKFCERD